MRSFRVSCSLLIIGLGACARITTPNPSLPAHTPPPSGAASPAASPTPPTSPTPAPAPSVISRDNASRISEVGSWQARFSSQATWNDESTKVYLPNLDDVFVYDVIQFQHEQISFNDYAQQSPLQFGDGIHDKGNCSDLGKDLYAISPDKTMLATGWSYGHKQPPKTVIDLWDLANKRCLFQFPEYAGWLSALTFSPSGDYLVFSTDWATYNWNIKKNKITCKIMYSIGATFIPGKDTLAATDIREWLGYRTGLWDVKKCALVQKYTNGSLYSTYNPNGDLFASTDGSRVLILDAKTGELLIELEGHPNDVDTIAFSPDGRYLLSGSAGGPGSMSTYILWAVKH